MLRPTRCRRCLCEPQGNIAFTGGHGHWERLAGVGFWGIRKSTMTRMHTSVSMFLL